MARPGAESIAAVLAAGGGEELVLLGRSDILTADDRTYDLVNCPEWGGSVLLRSLTGQERDAYEQSLVTERKGKTRLKLGNFRSRLIVLSAITADGGRLFTAADVENLGSRNAAPISRLFDAASELSGISEKDIEELTEGFENGPSDDSSTG